MSLACELSGPGREGKKLTRWTRRVEEYQMATRKVAAEVSATVQHCHLARLQREHFDVGFFPPGRARHSVTAAPPLTEIFFML